MTTNIRVDYEGEAPYRAGDVYIDDWPTPLGRLIFLPEVGAWKMWVNLPDHVTGGYTITVGPGMPDLVEDPDDAALVVAWQAAIDDAPAKRGRQLAVGDVIRHFGEDHTITRLRPYGPSDLDFVDDRWRVADCGQWSRTIEPESGWRQLPDGAWVSSHLYVREIETRFGGLLALLRAGTSHPAASTSTEASKENAR